MKTRKPLSLPDVVDGFCGKLCMSGRYGWKSRRVSGFRGWKSDGGIVRETRDPKARKWVPS